MRLLLLLLLLLGVAGTRAACPAEGEWPETEAGAEAAVVCDVPEAFETRRGLARRSCDAESAWGEPGACVPDCPALGGFPQTPPGSVASASCAATGMPFVGTMTRACSREGEWAAAADETACVRVCPLQFPWGFGDLGTTYTLPCGSGRVGQMTRHCHVSGSWEDAREGDCREACAADGEWPATAVGETALVECELPLVGDVARSCGEGGVWAAPDAGGCGERPDWRPVAFDLIDAIRDVTLCRVGSDSPTIDLDSIELPSGYILPGLSYRAVLDPDEERFVGRVFLQVCDDAGCSTRTESSSPFSMYGDSGGNYRARLPPAGQLLTLSARSEDSITGFDSASYTANLTFVRGGGGAAIDCGVWTPPHACVGTLCPAGQFPDPEDGCACSCGAGRVAVGAACECAAGRSLDGDSGECVCDAVPCEGGSVDADCACQCPGAQELDAESGACACAPAPCEGGSLGAETCECECEAPKVVFDGACVCAAAPCGGGLGLDADTCECVCPEGRSFDADDGACACDAVPCEGGAQNDETCACECPEGRSLNAASGACECDAVPCAGGAQSDETCECVCPEGRLFLEAAGACACAPVPCEGGAQNDATCACECPEGRSLNAGSGACECDAVPCGGGGGAAQSDETCECECPEGRSLDEESGACECDAPRVDDGGDAFGCACPACAAHLVPDGGDACGCECPDGLVLSDDGEACECEAPHVLDAESGECACPACGDGLVLVSDATCACGCPDGMVLDAGSGECQCEAPHVLDGESGECACPACGDGRVPSADRSACACECPEGTSDGGDAAAECRVVCEAPRVPDDAGETCVCEACEAPRVPDTAGGAEDCACACPAGLVDVDGACLPPLPECEAPRVPDEETRTCVCEACEAPFERDTGDGAEDCACACPAGLVEEDGECLEPLPECEAPRVPDAGTRTCVCEACAAPFERDTGDGAEDCACACPAPLADDGEGGCACDASATPCSGGALDAATCECSCGAGLEAAPGGAFCFQSGSKGNAAEVRLAGAVRDLRPLLFDDLGRCRSDSVCQVPLTDDMERLLLVALSADDRTVAVTLLVNSEQVLQRSAALADLRADEFFDAGAEPTDGEAAFPFIVSVALQHDLGVALGLPVAAYGTVVSLYKASVVPAAAGKAARAGALAVGDDDSVDVRLLALVDPSEGLVNPSFILESLASGGEGLGEGVFGRGVTLRRDGDPGRDVARCVERYEHTEFARDEECTLGEPTAPTIASPGDDSILEEVSGLHWIWFVVAGVVAVVLLTLCHYAYSRTTRFNKPEYRIREDGEAMFQDLKGRPMSFADFATASVPNPPAPQLPDEEESAWSLNRLLDMEAGGGGTAAGGTAAAGTAAAGTAAAAAAARGSGSDTRSVSSNGTYGDGVDGDFEDADALHDDEEKGAPSSGSSRAEGVEELALSVVTGLSLRAVHRSATHDGDAAEEEEEDAEPYDAIAAARAYQFDAGADDDDDDGKEPGDDDAEEHDLMREEDEPYVVEYEDECEEKYGSHPEVYPHPADAESGSTAAVAGAAAVGAAAAVAVAAAGGSDDEEEAEEGEAVEETPAAMAALDDDEATAADAAEAAAVAAAVTTAAAAAAGSDDEEEVVEEEVPAALAAVEDEAAAEDSVVDETPAALEPLDDAEATAADAAEAAAAGAAVEAASRREDGAEAVEETPAAMAAVDDDAEAEPNEESVVDETPEAMEARSEDGLGAAEAAAAAAAVGVAAAGVAAVAAQSDDDEEEEEEPEVHVQGLSPEEEELFAGDDGGAPPLLNVPSAEMVTDSLEPSVSSFVSQSDGDIAEDIPDTFVPHSDVPGLNFARAMEHVDDETTEDEEEEDAHGDEMDGYAQHDDDIVDEIQVQSSRGQLSAR